jgi:hypothetical protein
MTIIRRKIPAALVSASIIAFQFSIANAAGLAVTTFPTRVKFSGCTARFQRIMQDMGMTDINGDNSGRGGTIGAVRAHVVCVPIPNGICGNATGLTLVISAAGDSFDNARNVVNNLRSAWGDPVLIDCN